MSKGPFFEAGHPQSRFRVLFHNVAIPAVFDPTDFGTERVSNITVEHAPHRGGTIHVTLREVHFGRVGEMLQAIKNSRRTFEIVVEALDAAISTWKFRTAYSGVRYTGHSYRYDYAVPENLLYSVTLTFDDHLFEAAPEETPLLP